MAFCLFCTRTCYIIHVHGSMAFYVWYKLLSSTLAHTYVEGHAGVCLCVFVCVCVCLQSPSYQCFYREITG